MKPSRILKRRGLLILSLLLLAGCTASSAATSAEPAPSTLSEPSSGTASQAASLLSQSSSHTQTSTTEASSKAASSKSAPSKAAPSEPPTSSAVSSAPAGPVFIDAADHLTEWGLGDYQSAYVGNNRDYNWYVDQFSTGDYYDTNCGPTCLEMACRWYDQSFSVKAAAMRSQINIEQKDSSSQGVYPKYMTFILEYYKIPNETKQGISTDKIKAELEAGNILIVPLDMGCVTFESNYDFHVNKYNYRFANHYIIVKGYRIVDGKTWLEVYDPNSHFMCYADGIQPMGRDRYYAAEEVVEGTKEYKDLYIVIGGNKVTTSSVGPM